MNIFAFNTNNLILRRSLDVFFSEETKPSRLKSNRIYENGGRNIRFGIVFDEMAEKFPEAKFSRLKDLIQSKTYM